MTNFPNTRYPHFSITEELYRFGADGNLRLYSYDSTNQLVSAANAQTYALSVTYGDWGKIQEYGLSQTDLANNLTTSVVCNYSYGSLNEGQTAFAPNNISYADGTNVNEQYGIGGSLLKRETNRPGNQPNEELYRFGADGNLRMFLPQAFQQNSGMGLSSSR